LRTIKVPLVFSTLVCFGKKKQAGVCTPPSHTMSLSNTATVQTGTSALKEWAHPTLLAGSRTQHALPACVAWILSRHRHLHAANLTTAQITTSPQLCQKTNRGPEQAPRRAAGLSSGSPDIQQTRGDLIRAALIRKLWPR